MNELKVVLPVNAVNENSTTTSLMVAEVFGKEHKNVIRDIENLDIPEEFSRLNFEPSDYTNDRGKKYPMYNITYDGFSILVMGFTGPSAMKFKLAYIEAFNRMEKHIANAITVPKTLSEALRLAADQADKIASQASLITNQDEKILNDAPGVAFSNSIAISDDTILIRDLAKDIASKLNIKIGGSRMFSWMRDAGYIVKASTEPTQKSIELGVLEVLERTIQGNSGSLITRTTKVTGKGQIYFMNKFIKMKNDKCGDC